MELLGEVHVSGSVYHIGHYRSLLSQVHLPTVPVQGDSFSFLLMSDVLSGLRTTVHGAQWFLAVFDT
jgi:hypothetical protein